LLRLGQRQPKVANLPKIAVPVELHDVNTLSRPLRPRLNQPQDPPHSRCPIQRRAIMSPSSLSPKFLDTPCLRAVTHRNHELSRSALLARRLRQGREPHETWEKDRIVYYGKLGRQRFDWWSRFIGWSKI
jgi:hypothetical protein